MHESTQRLLCRAAFLLVCVVPTFCTLAWIAYRHSDLATRSVERKLSERIGLRCHVDRYYNPRPELHVFEGLTLEVAGSPAVTLPLVKAERIDRQWQISGPSGQIAWAHRRRLWETIQESTSDTAAWSSDPVRIAIAELSFTDLDLPPMSQLQVRIDRPAESPGMPKIEATGQLTQDRSSPAIRLAITRPSESAAGLDVRFQTDEQGIPVGYLAHLFPHLETFGQLARYHGNIRWNSTVATPQMQLQGVFRHVDLHPLLTQTYQIHARGLVDLHLQQGDIQGDTLAKAHGWIMGLDGQIAGGFAAQAVEVLGLQSARSSLELERDLVAYRELAVEFLLEGGQLSLAGHCREMPPGTILAGLRQPILGQPVYDRQPATNLVTALIPDASPTVPATKRSVILARWLSPEVPVVAEGPIPTELR